MIVSYCTYSIIIGSYKNIELYKKKTIYLCVYYLHPSTKFIDIFIGKFMKIEESRENRWKIMFFLFFVVNKHLQVYPDLRIQCTVRFYMYVKIL